MGEICIPTGDQCYNCEDYAGAFACLKKIKISGMSVLSELELQAALGNECGDIRVAASVMPCEGGAYTTAVSLKDLVGSIGGGNPLAGTFWTPFDLGNVYQGCWYKFNKDLLISRTEFPEFFTAAGISGESYTIKGMEGKLAMGSGTNYCNNSEILGNSGSDVTLSCENLPSCAIQINDPAHKHRFYLGLDKEGTNGTTQTSIEVDSDKKGFVTDYNDTEKAFTGITATHKVGQGGNGNPVAINVQPWSQCGSWYIKLSNDCN